MAASDAGEPLCSIKFVGSQYDVIKSRGVPAPQQHPFPVLAGSRRIRGAADPVGIGQGVPALPTEGPIESQKSASFFPKDSIGAGLGSRSH